MLGRVYDAIEYRGFGQSVVEELAQYAGVPVYNGLTNEFHPTQILADFLTMQEHVEKPLRDVAYVFIGDAANNMGDSLLIGGAKMGMDVRLCAPKACWPNQAVQDEARALAAETGAGLPSLRTSTLPLPALISCIPMSGSRWVSPRKSGPSASNC